MSKLFKKLDTFKKLSPATKRLFAEALVTSAWVKLCLLFFPFKRVLGWMGNPHVESDPLPDEGTLQTRKEVKAALQLCKKYALWPTECYTTALTGKILLRRRHIASTIYIGFMKDDSGKYKGHAWLRANEIYISGYRESIGYHKNIIFS